MLTDDEPRPRDREPRAAGRRRRAGPGAGGDGLAGARHGAARVGGAATPQAAYAQPGDKELPRVDGHLTAAAGPRAARAGGGLPTRWRSSDGKRVAMLHCGWRGLAGGHRREGGGGVRRAAGRRRRARRSGAAATRSGRRCSRRSRTSPGVAAGACSICARWPRRRLRGGRGGRASSTSDRCTSCRAELYFSHRRDRGVTGRQGGLAWLTRDRRREVAGRATSSGSASGSPAPSVEICAAMKYVRREELPALAEAGIELVGREPRPGPAGQAGAPPRPVHLGLHRRAAEPQGEGRRARTCG